MSRRYVVTYVCDGCGRENEPGEKMPDGWEEVWRQVAIKDGEGRAHLQSESLTVCSARCLAQAFQGAYPKLNDLPQ